MFMGKEFVVKHIRLKHKERVDAERDRVSPDVPSCFAHCITLVCSILPPPWWLLVMPCSKCLANVHQSAAAAASSIPDWPDLTCLKMLCCISSELSCAETQHDMSPLALPVQFRLPDCNLCSAPAL